MFISEQLGMYSVTQYRDQDPCEVAHALAIGVGNKPTVVRGGARVYPWRRAHMLNLQTIRSRPKIKITYTPFLTNEYFDDMMRTSN
mmetsp:Transcript_97348/g.156979  ORF Transcript_97348/g.156979 Transcript_97348/m.156979 type:complete len:86 (+) Transcript_97348:1462-1719(+)